MSRTGQPPRSGVVWSGPLHVRARPWPALPDCALLLIGASHHPGSPAPTEHQVRQWLDTVSEWGYSRVRTNAVPDSVAETLALTGFDVAQDLALLRRPHATPPRFDIPRDARPTLVRRVSAHSVDILDLDDIAFGHEWHLDAQSLADALAATSSARVWVSRRDETLQGFVVAGLTGRTGYVQRLAVHPSVRRSGVASRLVARALQWTHRRGATGTLVNTEVTNDAALGLYRGLGFEVLDHRLKVMERSL
ncbi:MAG: GNAT family N-acetyltransferase [Ilumatobacteraceae bacterium]